MKIIVFGGTTEGRKFSHLMADKGADVLVLVASPYGEEEQREYKNISVLVGRKTTEEMKSIIEDYDICIDATHPYAVEVSKNILSACNQVGKEYHRLLRQSSETSDGIYVSNAEEAAELLLNTNGNILLTIGVKELDAFSILDKDRLYPRVLPSISSIEKCQELKIPHRNIIAMQGPFTEEMNIALINQFDIKYLVTKDGGTQGGFMEKINAAKKTEITTIVINRPFESGESFDTIVNICDSKMN